MPSDNGMGLDPNDPDIQMLDGPPANVFDQTRSYQPSVEEVPDEHHRLERHLAQRSSINESIHPSRAPSNQRQPDQNEWNQPGEPSPQESGENYYHIAADEVSPLVSPKIGRDSSDGGGYFPKVPNLDDSTHDFALPDAPPQDPGSPPVLDLPGATTFPPGPFPKPDERPSHPPHRNSLESFPPPHMNQPTVPTAAQVPLPPYPHAQHQPQPRQIPTNPPDPFINPLPKTHHPHTTQTSSSRSAEPQTVSSKSNYVADEEAVIKAQKHARWAISALNFEDVNTAVKELRGALEALGGT